MGLGTDSCIFTHILYDHYNLWPSLNLEEFVVSEEAAAQFLENVQVSFVPSPFLFPTFQMLSLNVPVYQ